VNESNIFSYSYHMTVVNYSDVLVIQ